MKIHSLIYAAHVDVLLDPEEMEYLFAYLCNVNFNFSYESCGKSTRLRVGTLFANEMVRRLQKTEQSPLLEKFELIAAILSDDASAMQQIAQQRVGKLAS